MANRRENTGASQVEKLTASHGVELSSLANSSDGKKVKAIVERDADKLQKAIKDGDMTALKDTFQTLMGTQEGARLIGKIQDMMK